MKSKVVIDVWVADLTFPGYMDRLYKLGEDFDNAHPEYHVNIQGCDFRTLPQQIAEAAAKGAPPAIAECYFYITGAARDFRRPDGNPLFTSVEKAIAGRTEILGEPVVIDDIIAGVRDYYTYQGDLTSMPSVATTSLLFGNADLLAKAGITTLPRTWDEVTAACETIAATPGGPPHAITWCNHGTFIQQAIAAQGGELANNDNGRSGRATTVDLASKEMLAWASWWAQLHRAGHYVYTGKIPDWQGNLALFANQQVALRITSSNDLNYMVAAAEGSGFDMTVGRFPDNSNAPYEGNAIAGTSLWLADGLDQATQDGALAFLQFMHNPRHAAEQHKFNSFVPITNASYELLEQEGWFDAHPHHRLASQQLKTFPLSGVADEQIAAGLAAPASRGALFGDFAGVQDVMTHAMGEVLLNGADVATRFAEATVEAQQLLDAYLADAEDGGPTRPESVRVEYFRDAEWYSGADLENVVQLKKPT